MTSVKNVEKVDDVKRFQELERIDDVGLTDDVEEAQVVDRRGMRTSYQNGDVVDAMIWRYKGSGLKFPWLRMPPGDLIRV